MATDTNEKALVIGGGIAGIQASIDLANMGAEVYLVERTPSIGGRMAQLDKTFPTNDCSICILAPKMIECAGHENVELLTYSEVVECRGKAGRFKVKVRKMARHVDVTKCTGCGDCMEKCPVKIPDEFNMALIQRRAIYLPFPQAVPRKATIDHKHCRFFTKGKCRICEKICQAKAIDFEEKDKILELEVGAIILATGFDLFDISSLSEFGYGRVKDVITAMEYERLISASGPTSGHLHRPSDDKVPEKLGFVQCVGSRDVRGQPYCSSVCCMHATKEAILANEHYPGITSYIFFTDMRAVGKRFQEYVSRAKEEYNVHYIRGRPGKVVENPETGNPVLWYENTQTREVRGMELDLVILCQAMIPHGSHKMIAETLGIETDPFGFVQIPDKLSRPMDSTVPGILACGFCQSPQDIPDSVVQASGAAARAAEVLTGRN